MDSVADLFTRKSELARHLWQRMAYTPLHELHVPAGDQLNFTNGGARAGWPGRAKPLVRAPLPLVHRLGATTTFGDLVPVLPGA